MPHHLRKLKWCKFCVLTIHVVTFNVHVIIKGHVLKYVGKPFLAVELYFGHNNPKNTVGPVDYMLTLQ